MMHEQTMQDHLSDTNFGSDPSPGSGNRNTDAQDSGNRGFYNQWDGGGAGGWHGPPAEQNSAQSQSRGSESHAGRGPKNYQRSDARISEDVHRILTEDDELDASDIELSVNGGEVTLTGTVHSRDARRHAEMLLDDVAGVTQVNNRIKVNQTNNNIGA